MDCRLVDAMAGKPLLDRRDAVVVGGEHLDNFLSGQVLAIVGRLRVGAVEDNVSQRRRLASRCKLHVIELVFGLLEVALLQSNLKGNAGIGSDGRTLDIASLMNLTTLLVDSVGVRGEGKGTSSQAGEKKSGLHN